MQSGEIVVLLMPHSSRVPGSIPETLSSGVTANLTRIKGLLKLKMMCVNCLLKEGSTFFQREKKTQLCVETLTQF